MQLCPQAIHGRVHRWYAHLGTVAIVISSPGLKRAMRLAARGGVVRPTKARGAAARVKRQEELDALAQRFPPPAP